MLTCNIITSETGLDAIADGWRQLYARARSSPVADYDRFRVQWDMLGRHDTRKLHVVAGYRDGQLAGVLPLTVLKRSGVRFLQADSGSGAECDLLAETPADAATLWQAARKSPHYDFARIQGVCPQTLCETQLRAFATMRDPVDYFFVNNRWTNSKEWLESLAGNVRREYRRKVRRLEETAPLKHEIYQGGPVPTAIVDGMIKHKTEWAARNSKEGYLNNPNFAPYYRKLIETAAVQGSLFLAWLICGESVIGYNFGFLDQDKLHSQMLAYDPEYARYAPAEVTMVSMVCWAIDKGLKSINFMSSTEESEKRFKRKYANDVVPGAEYTFSGSLRGKIMETAFIAGRKVMRMIRGTKEKATGAPAEKDDSEKREA